MYGLLSPGHVGIEPHGVTAWFARFAVKWAHKLHEIDPVGSPRSSVFVYRHLSVPGPVPGRHARGSADPVIRRPGGASIYIKIDPEQYSGRDEAVRTIESAARAEQVRNTARTKPDTV